MDDCLAIIDIGQKVGAVVPLSVGGALDPHLTQCGLIPYEVASWSIWPQQTWAEKGGLCPFWGLSPHLTQCGLGRGYLCAKWHLDPFNCLATIPQRHRQKRQHRTDRLALAAIGLVRYCHLISCRTSIFQKHLTVVRSDYNCAWFSLLMERKMDTRQHILCDRQ